MGAGVAWLDYDGDGWLDLYVVQSGPFPPDGSEGAANRLYRNLGAGDDGAIRFEDVTERAGVGDRRLRHGGDGGATSTGTATSTSTSPTTARTSSTGTGATGPSRTPPPRPGSALDGWSSVGGLRRRRRGRRPRPLRHPLRRVPGGARPLLRRPGERRAALLRPVALRGRPRPFYGTADPERVRHLRGRHRGGRPRRRGRPGPGGALHRPRRRRRAGPLRGERRDDELPVPQPVAGRRAEPGTFEDLSLLSGTAVEAGGKPEAGMGLVAADFDTDGDPDLAVTNFDVETNTYYENLGGMQFADRSAAQRLRRALLQPPGLRHGAGGPGRRRRPGRVRRRTATSSSARAGRRSPTPSATWCSWATAADGSRAALPGPRGDPPGGARAGRWRTPTGTAIRTWRCATTAARSSSWRATCQGSRGGAIGIEVGAASAASGGRRRG